MQQAESLSGQSIGLIQVFSADCQITGGEGGDLIPTGQSTEQFRDGHSGGDGECGAAVLRGELVPELTGEHIADGLDQGEDEFLMISVDTHSPAQGEYILRHHS